MDLEGVKEFCSEQAQLVTSGQFKLHNRQNEDSTSCEYYERLEEFRTQCFDCMLMLGAEEVGFTGAMQLLKLYTLSLPEEFPSKQFELIINYILKNRQQILLALLSKAINEYNDLFYYGMRILRRVCISEEVVDVLSILEKISVTKAPLISFCFDRSEELPKWKARAGEFSDCWLSFLQSQETRSDKQLRRILIILDQKVLPFISKPAVLIDYLSSAFRKGGVIGWLSLSGLFYLIQKHRLDYPRFFEQLYSILTPQVMRSRYRKRFLRLFGTFMRSTHISGEQLQMFLKRISRLALAAPPSAAHWIIPFCYNMLKEHAELRSLVHSSKATELPQDSNSLWELSVLFNHHIGHISKQSHLLKERFTRPPFDLEKYLRDGDKYSVPQMLKDELDHKWSRPPPLSNFIPLNLL